MYQMFRGAEAFNKDIGHGITSSVTTMLPMFYDAMRSTRISVHGNLELGHDHGKSCSTAEPSAFNQHLSRWDVSSVTTMAYMFYDADAFNTMPVGWDTSKVTDSSRYFHSADAWYARFTGGGDDTLPGAVDAHRQRVRRVLRPSTAPSAPAPTPS